MGYAPNLSSIIPKGFSWDELLKIQEELQPVTERVPYDVNLPGSVGPGLETTPIAPKTDAKKGKEAYNKNADFMAQLRQIIFGPSGSPETNVTSFDTKNTEDLLSSFMASLEDPYKQSLESTKALMNKRGLLNSGIKDEEIGKLMASYNQAAGTKASDLGTDLYNKRLQESDADYNQNLQSYLLELENKIAKSGQDASQFYNENQALIDAQLQKYASDKQSNYENIASDYSTKNQEFWDNMNAYSDLFGEVGKTAGNYLSSSSQNKPYDYSSTYDYNPSNLSYNYDNLNSLKDINNVIGSTVTKKNFDPYSRSVNYGKTIGGY